MRWQVVNGMQALLAGYSREELATLLDFAERGGDLMLKRVAELNRGTQSMPAGARSFRLTVWTRGRSARMAGFRRSGRGLL